jgi:plastocyanin
VVLTRGTAVSAAVCVALLCGGRLDRRSDAGVNAPGPGLAPPAGTLRGRVVIEHPARSDDPAPGIAELGADMAYRPVERRQAVVYLETAPRGAFEDVVRGHATMKQEHETFVPHVIAIQVGGSVDFPNDDPFFHNVFSLSKARRFDLGRYPRGQSKSVRFDEPGVVRVFCDIHSHMSAFILVFAHRFFAVTDDEGRYRIDDVPAGSWAVAVWYEGTVRASRRVTVPAAGGAVDADFSVPGR